MEKSLILLDCTLRDGGYYNNWDFSPELINDYLHSMSALGADYVEIGFRSFDHNGFKGGCAYSTDSFVRNLDVPKGLKLGVMVNSSDLLKYTNGVIPALSKLFKPASESSVTLVRIACHMHEAAMTFPCIKWLKEQGYVVGINLMQIADRSNDEVELVGQLAQEHNPDVLYFADSMGSMDNAQTTRIIKALRKSWKGDLGIHTHDNMGKALSNSLCAIDEGVTWIDSTVTGMGRGPGNVQTEYLAIELTERRKVFSNITPLLTVINKHFNPLKAKYNWGSNPYYYLAGKYGIHPTYIQEMISDSRYSNEDLLVVIEHLRQSGGKKFNVQTLETGRNFYNEDPHGTWSPAEQFSGREILLVAHGLGATQHRQAIEDYITIAKPIVIALNAQTTLKEELINFRAACHPVRLMTDYTIHLALPQPLITPASMLPETVLTLLQGKKLLDFGLKVQGDVFTFAEKHCVLPTSIVLAYALAIAASGKTPRVLMAGFDGYAADDSRGIEVEKLLTDYQKTIGVPPLLAITPTRYKLATTSVYCLI